MCDIYKINDRIYASNVGMNVCNTLCLDYEEFIKEEEESGINDHEDNPREVLMCTCYLDIVNDNKNRNLIKDEKLDWVIKDDYIYIYFDGPKVREDIIPYLPDKAADILNTKKENKKIFRIKDYSKNFSESLWK